MVEIEFYKKLFSYYDKTDDICVLFNSKGLIIDLNDTGIKVFNYPKKYLIGSSIFNLVAAEERPQAKILFKGILKGKTYKGDMSIVDRHGKKIFADLFVGSDVFDTERVYYLLAKNQSKVINMQERFEKLFSANPIPTVMTKLETGEIVDMNASYSKLTGYTKEEAIGKTTLQLKIYTTEERQRIIENINKGIRPGDSYPIEIKTRDRFVRHCIVYPEVIDVENEKYFLSVYVDHTDDMSKKEELEKSLWRLDINAQAASIASSKMSASEKIKGILGLVKGSASINSIFIFDIKNNKYTYKVPDLKQVLLDDVKIPDNDIKQLLILMGHKGNLFDNQLKGISKNTYSIINPQKSLSFMLVPIYTDNIFTNIMSVTRSAGKESWKKEEIDLILTLGDILSNVYEQDFDASLIVQKANENEMSRNAILNVLEDVEDEKNKSDKLANDLVKFELAVSQTSDHIAILDNQGIVIYANSAVEKITGYSPQEVIGKSPDELWGESMPEDFHKNLWEFIKESKKTYKGEFNNRKKNGEIYVADATISPVINEKGDVIFFVEVERDITRLKEIDKMKNEFISIASHQLRTPLSTMKWYLEILLGGDAGKMTPQQMDFLQNLNVANERMIELVNSLLNVSRIESGRIIIEPHLIKIRDLLDGVLSDISQKAIEKNIVIKIEIAKGIPAVNMDIRLISNALMNIMTNAIKYSPKKTTIVISVNKIVGKDEVIFKIKDQGYGILDADKDKIFSKFFRGRNIIKYDTNGNGIGLYLVRTIVETSGGHIWFESKVNKGTTFYFTLPIKGVPRKEGEVTLE